MAALPASPASFENMDMASSYMVHSAASLTPDPMSNGVIHESRALQPHELAMNPHLFAAQRRRSSKGAPVKVPKRSASSPNVRDLLGSSDSTSALAEKRRNKLGYHRTSVACVHCRRRKIRCLLAPDDPHNRCSNCIRLKKECNFFPVEQQPPEQRKAPRKQSKADSTQNGENSNSGSSSPTIGSHGPERSESFSHLPQMGLASHGFSTPMLPLDTSTISPHGSSVSSRVDDGHVGWNPQFFDGQQIPTGQAPADDASAFWKVQETPMTPAFSPFTAATPSSVLNGGAPGQYPQFAHPGRPEPGWQPVRSMSYSQIDELATHQRNGSFSMPYASDMRRSTVDMMAVPSLHSSISSASTASMVDMPAMPMSGPPMAAAQFVTNPGWNSLTAQSPKATDLNGNWFPEAQPLPKVQEEEQSFGDEAVFGTPVSQ